MSDQKSGKDGDDGKLLHSQLLLPGAAWSGTCPGGDEITGQTFRATVSALLNSETRIGDVTLRVGRYDDEVQAEEV